ncbi:Long-chain-fatty-acid--CoA ligase [Pontiella desulfatans]|uniref:Long-chain-fatty-acid--CoA ligase n=1 Tax=Pontiella desulfatans TaxID=2750659 RepID=A0A6C2TWK3_PONDE|nr:fatty acid--CoA ligase family protein [Pontiella desulfatans]VGO12048.1 Long-chain-fatty-acid--CoA ligase [Pontiella desulfatans]
MNIVDLIRSETAGLPENKIAVRTDGGDLSYRGLFEAVDETAAALKLRGVDAFDVVGLAFPDGVDYIVLSLAILSVGAVIVPVPHGVATEVVEDILEKTSSSWLLVPEGNGFRLDKREPAVALPDEFQTLQPAFIRFSSGTTSTSKGVLLSHPEIAERTRVADQALRITPADTVVWLLSMSFHFVVTILLFLRRGATINLCNETFPCSLLAAVQRGGTFIYGTPFHFRALAENGSIGAEALAGIRMAVSTAMKLPAETASAFLEKFGVALKEAYGLIEAGLPFVNTGGEGDSVGCPLPGFEVEIRDADENQVGEVWLRGPGMYSAYLHPWRVRRPDEWFATGDVGMLDAVGALHLLGRTKNLINFAGMKVFPYEVEAVLARCAGVEASLVYARPHPHYGQLPCAKVVAPGLAEEALRRFCYEHLESYKVPKNIEIVEHLERTASGKIKREEATCF